MPIEFFAWDEYAESSRGLLARPLLPNNVVAIRSHIDLIEYWIKNRTTNGVPEVGTIDPNVAMLVAPSGKGTWPKDDIGFTFNWILPGNLIPEPNCIYQIVITFRVGPGLPALEGRKFIRVWKASTFDPQEV